MRLQQRFNLAPQAILLTFVALFMGCGDDSETNTSDNRPLVCQAGTTQSCICTDGSGGAQSCANDSWQACVCDGAPICQSGSSQACVCTNGAVGSQSCSGSDWGSCECEALPPQKEYGDLCVAPDFNCADSGELFCVIDSAGDTQGICRVPCQTNLSCVGNELAFDAGDTNCCDVVNGTRACFAPFTCN